MPPPLRPARLARLLALALAPGALLAGASPAHASRPDPELELTQRPAAIVGGEPSASCAWPKVVALRSGGLCTGTLIHPRVIAYAAHCGAFHSSARFGEDVDNPARERELLYCERNSELFAVSSMDYAFCVLAEPVEDIAVTPPLFGCDEDLIEVGTPVTIVGFGDTTVEGPEQTGIKHEAQTTITGKLSLIGIGGMGTGADSGDSGGPAFVELDDGSWRLLGIVSGGGGDGGTVQYVPAPVIIAWIEERSGIDITPCHDSEGAWAPTPACEGFFVATQPDASWAQGCPSQVSPPSQRCGPPWTAISDDEGPIVSFTYPLDGQDLLGPPSLFDLTAEADDLDGIGVLELRLRVDGEPWLDAYDLPAVDQVPPYRFEQVRLDAPGPHTLTLEAVDALGNTSLATITVHAGATGDEADESGDEEQASGEESGSIETETGSSAGSSQESPDAPGCACSIDARPRAPAPLGLLVLIVLGAFGSRARDRASPPS